MATPVLFGAEMPLETPVAAEPTTPNAGAPGTGSETNAGSSVQTATTTPSPTTTSAPTTTPTEASSTSAVPPADERPAWWTALDDVDTKELAKHPKFSGLLGNHADRLANQRIEKAVQEAVAKARNEENARLEQQRLERLRQTDRNAYLEELAQQDEQKRQQDSQLSVEQQHRQQAWADVDTVMNSLYFKQPEEVQAKLNGKQYNAATPGESRLQYLDDLVSARAEAEVGKAVNKAVADARKKWESEELPARIRAANAASVGSEPSPDLGGDGRPTSPQLTQEDFDRNRHTPGWIKSNLKAVQAAVNAGRIRR